MIRVLIRFVDVANSRKKLLLCYLFAHELLDSIATFSENFVSTLFHICVAIYIQKHVIIIYS